MNKPLKIIKIGNSAGIVLPEEVLAHLDRVVGDELTLVLKPNGIELLGVEPDEGDQVGARPEGHTQPRESAGVEIGVVMPKLGRV